MDTMNFDLKCGFHKFEVFHANHDFPIPDSGFVQFCTNIDFGFFKNYPLDCRLMIDGVIRGTLREIFLEDEPIKWLCRDHNTFPFTDTIHSSREEAITYAKREGAINPEAWVIPVCGSYK